MVSILARPFERALPSLADALKASQANYNAGVPQLNANGLYDAQQNGFNVFGRNMFNSVSGDYASRGFNSPDNVNAVIGSALTQAAPSLMDQIRANIGQNNTMQNNNLNSWTNALNAGGGLLGSNSNSTSTTTSPGIGYTFGTSFANSLGQTLGGGGGGNGSTGAIGAKALFA